MSSKWDETSEKLAEVADCKRMIRRIAKIIAPDAANRKDQYRELKKFTGFAERRLKDLWHGYLNTIPSHQTKRIRAAYVEALKLRRERALVELEHIEREHEELTRAAAGYASERWTRAIETRALAGPLGERSTE